MIYGDLRCCVVISEWESHILSHTRKENVHIFGEIPRHAKDGAEVFFVPFSTDEKRAYHRVSSTAQTRCIENSIYTVIAANVGNLPGVKTYWLNYGQSAVFVSCTSGGRTYRIETAQKNPSDQNRTTKAEPYTRSTVQLYS